MSKTLSPPKTRRSRAAAATVAELLRQLGDIPAERVRMDPPPSLATKMDLLRLLEQNNIPCELVNGTLVEKAMGQIESSLAVWLSHFFCAYLEGRPIGRVFGADAPHELKAHLIRMPDVAFATNERIPSGPARKRAVASWAPDLAVEILSKGNTRAEIDMKRREYFDAGVRLVWIVDPRKRTVNVYTSFETCTELTENDLLDGGDVLPGFQLNIRNWFAKVE